MAGKNAKDNYLYFMPDTGLILSNIKRLFHQEEFAAKTLLIDEGTIAKKLYFIEKGAARVFFNNDGKDVTFQFLLEGQFISSFESLLNNEPSWYSIEALEPMVVYSIPAADFKQKME